MLLASLCAAQGLGTIAADLNRTHARNPAWTGHARFHVVWQIATTVLLALLEIALLYGPGAPRAFAFDIAAALAALPMLGFFFATCARTLFGATLSDPNGIPPLTIPLRRSTFRLDMSSVVEATAALVLTGIVLFYHASPH